MQTHVVRLAWQTVKPAAAWSMLNAIQSLAAYTLRNIADKCSVSSRRRASSSTGHGLLGVTGSANIFHRRMPSGWRRRLYELWLSALTCTHHSVGSSGEKGEG